MTIYVLLAVVALQFAVAFLLAKRLAAASKPEPPPPAVSRQALKMMGLEVPGDQKVPMPVRDWHAMKLALWRSKWAWGIAMREATRIVEQCAHVEGCPGVVEETAPCLGTCRDREHRMSALVILNAGRQFSPPVAHKPEDAYFAPSREYFSEVIAELMAARAELEALRAASITIEPPPNPEPVELSEPEPFVLEEQ